MTKICESDRGRVARLDPGSSWSRRGNVEANHGADKASVLTPGRKFPLGGSWAKRSAFPATRLSLAYQQLVAEGHLVARERKRVFRAR